MLVVVSGCGALAVVCLTIAPVQSVIAPAGGGICDVGITVCVGVDGALLVVVVRLEYMEVAVSDSLQPMVVDHHSCVSSLMSYLQLASPMQQQQREE